MFSRRLASNAQSFINLSFSCRSGQGSALPIIFIMLSMNLNTVGVQCHGRADRTPSGDPFTLPEQNLVHNNFVSDCESAENAMQEFDVLHLCLAASFSSRLMTLGCAPAESSMAVSLSWSPAFETRV